MYSKLMVPLDGSKLAECVLPHVEALTGIEGSTRVVLVRVVKPYLAHFEDDVDGNLTVLDLTDVAEAAVDRERLQQASDYLENVAANLKVKGQVERVVLMGKPASALTRYAASNDIDLVIVATHGRSGISRWVRGSVAERILHSIGAPILMIRAPGCGVGN